MTNAEDEAKQLDSVTDNFDSATSNELDESKVKQAMSVLNDGPSRKGDGVVPTENSVEETAAMATKRPNRIKVSKEDIGLVVSELEVPEAAAERVIRECGGVVREALRTLVVS
mmetsp:Transcript_7032/g.15233  ORF Transcript_7032/g.15233 Transcript_7032/m.15233 type:complete len:113 (-) Transcript_7032:113-451(-)|eukprot:CAMPEP_0113316486 /NCGR_PEP_ID=MMETSP0010_2-20120614/11747_1 /TAXON_ID=216773 ORGANISM="Corethron hystrix, Strain 308" /NCGR_SAMPLE_ID=MMETSP0010_2 /ASSEMBLY_ACC=CAM_ASM_000155 /LENGTH=112 /DNA_ID=CAMNT_0000173221 /DNA_START=313 /DNA_END=651 /DNA_ORIENTATION=- /assembly_acc=CAM_ASM_000155